MDRKGRDVGINTTIATISGYITGIGFMVPVDRFKTAGENIVLTDRLLRRGKGTNVEGINGSRTLPVCMGMYLVVNREGIWKPHRDLSEV